MKAARVHTKNKIKITQQNWFNRLSKSVLIAAHNGAKVSAKSDTTDNAEEALDGEEGIGLLPRKEE